MKRLIAAYAVLFCGLAALAFQPGPFEVLQRERNFITDFGGIPNDGKDDGPAIARAITAARIGIANGLYHQVEIHFSGGEWTIDRNNALHPLIQEDGTLASSSGRPPFGIKFTGEAQNYTTLRLLRDEGEERWFYDAEDNPGWNRPQYEDLWFKSDMPGVETYPNYDEAHAAETNGFRIWATTASGGVDKGNVFVRCRFNGLGTPHVFTGTSNTDSLRMDACWYQNCGPVVFDNDQALNLRWDDCHFWAASQDVFHMLATTGTGGNGKGGAGSILITNADVLMQRVGSDTTERFFARIDDGAGFYRTWKMDACRWELRDTYQKLVNWVGASNLLTNSHLEFAGCDVSVMQTNGTTDADSSKAGRRNIIYLGPMKRLVFDRCYFANQLGIVFQDVTAGSVIGWAYQPVVELRGCGLPLQFVSGTNSDGDADDTTRGLQNRITLSNGYGRVFATGCYLRDPVPGFRMAVDFDYGGQNAVRGEPGVQRKRVYLKTSEQAWPNWTAGVAASERTILLPAGAKIIAAGIDRPAGGSLATNSIQYRIGNNDKTATYCATGPYRADGHHSAYTDGSTERGLFPIRVGTDLNTRTVRLWMGPVEHGHAVTGGEAWVEYE